MNMLKLKMADDVDERIVLASSTILFSSCAIFLNEVQKRKRRHSVWVETTSIPQCNNPLTAFQYFEIIAI